MVSEGGRLRPLFTELAEATVMLRIPSIEPVVASGFFVSADGHLATAHHCVKAVSWLGRFELGLTLADGRRIDGVEATVDPSGYDRAADWALLRLEGVEPSSWLPLGPSRAASPGDEVLAPGYTAGELPGRGLGDFRGRITRRVREQHLDVAFAVRGAGHSGGPVYHVASRRVVGITVGQYETEVMRDTGFVVTTDRALEGAPEAVRDSTAALRWDDRLRRRRLARWDDGLLLAPPRELPVPHLERRDLVAEAETRLAKGGAVVLHGPPGVGKTTLLVEIAQHLGAPVFWLDLDDVDRRAPLRVLRALALFLATAGLDHGAFDLAFPEGGAPDRREAETMIETLYPSVIEGLRRHPATLCFDNLHTVLRRTPHEPVAERDPSGDPLLPLLRRLARDLRGSAGRLLLTSWDRPDHRLPIPSVTVAGAGPESVARYLDLHGIVVQPETAGILWRGLDGNFVFLEAFVRLALERPQSGTSQGPTSRAIEDLLEEFLALDRTERDRYFQDKILAHADTAEMAVLTSFAVLGAAGLPREVVERVCDRPDFPRAFERLRTSPPVVLAQGETKGELFSVHKLLRDAVVRRTGLATRLPLHRRAAETWRRFGRPLESARHHLAADEVDRALEVLAKASEAILAAGEVEALDHVLQQVRRRLDDPTFEHPEADDLLAHSHLVTASSLHLRGRFEEAVRSFGYGIELAREGALALRMRLLMADSQRLMSDYEAAAQSYGVVLASPSVPPRERGRARVGLGKVHRLAADYPAALAAYGEAFHELGVRQDRRGLVEAHFGRGEVLRLLGRLAESRTAYRGSYELARELDSLERQAYALWGEGEVERLEGRLDAARDAHGEGLRLCRRVGDRRSEGWALLGLAEVERATADTEQALDLCARARRLFEDTGSITEIGHSALATAESRRLAGEADPAAYDEAMAIYERRRLAHCRVLTDLGRALAWLALGESSRFETALEAAAGVADTLGLPVETARIASVRRDQNPTALNPLNFP